MFCKNVIVLVSVSTSVFNCDDGDFVDDFDDVAEFVSGTHVLNAHVDGDGVCASPIVQLCDGEGLRLYI